MEQTLTHTISLPKTRDVLQVVGASLAIAFCAQLKVSFGPVPHTLQTLAVFCIGLMMTPRKAFAACICYLLEATAGLPVLAGLLSNPAWFIGPTAGFLAAFPFASALTSYLKNMCVNATVLNYFFSIMAGQVVIFTLGVAWLALQIGFQPALAFGLTPFLVTALIKNVSAALLYRAYQRSSN